MSDFGSALRKYIPATGQFAKSLTIVYFVWLFLIVVIVEYIFNTNFNHTHTSNNYFFGFMYISAASWVIPSTISLLHENVYSVLLAWGSSKQRKAYFNRLDERQLETRRRVFEKSYVLLVTIFVSSALAENNLLGGLSQNGMFIIFLNALMFVTSLPSLMATWETGVKATIFNPED